MVLTNNLLRSCSWIGFLKDALSEVFAEDVLEDVGKRNGLTCLAKRSAKDYEDDRFLEARFALPLGKI